PHAEHLHPFGLVGLNEKVVSHGRFLPKESRVLILSPSSFRVNAVKSVIRESSIFNNCPVDFAAPRGVSTSLRVILNRSERLVHPRPAFLNSQGGIYAECSTPHP